MQTWKKLYAEQCHYFKCICVEKAMLHILLFALYLSLSASFALALALCIFSSLVSKNFLQQHSREKRSTRSLFFCFKLAKDIHVVVLILCFILFLFENYLIQFVRIFFLSFLCSFVVVGNSLNVEICWKTERKKNERKKSRKKRHRVEKRGENKLSGLSTVEFMPHWNKLFALFFAHRNIVIPLC